MYDSNNKINLKTKVRVVVQIEENVNNTVFLQTKSEETKKSKIQIFVKNFFLTNLAAIFGATIGCRKLFQTFETIPYRAIQMGNNSLHTFLKRK